MRPKKSNAKKRILVGTRVGQNILKDLDSTELSMKTIASKHGVDPGTVANINKRYEVRSPGVVADIGIKSSLARKKKTHKKKSLRKKVCFFTTEKKLDLLKENHGMFVKIARSWWTYDPSRRKFNQDMSTLVQAMKEYVFDKLDYYNPKVKGRKGKAITPASWIYGGAELYCLNLQSKLNREKEKTMPLDQKGLPISQVVEVTKVKGVRAGSAEDLHWIPFTANKLLRKLGLNPNRVAKAGYKGIRKQIIEIATAKKTGLTVKEQRVIKMFLNGKTIVNAANILKTPKRTIYYISKIACKKIRIQIEIENLKTRER